jgi:hypothetical protein
MHEGTAPANIIDKNGRATVVWRKVMPAMPVGTQLPAAPPAPRGVSGDISYSDVVEAFGTVQRLRPKRDTPYISGAELSSYFKIELSSDPVLIGSGLKDSMRRIGQSETGIEMLEETIAIDGIERPVYFIGTELENKMEVFRAWIAEGAPCNDHIAFTENFTGNTTEWDNETKAWFAPKSDIAWTMDEDVAQQLIKAVTPY